MYESHELGLEIRAELVRRMQMDSDVRRILAFNVCEKYLLNVRFDSLMRHGECLKYIKLLIVWYAILSSLGLRARNIRIEDA